MFYHHPFDPQSYSLIINTTVDIYPVTPQSEAKVQLSAFKARSVDRIDATVETGSGDSLVNDVTGERYYLARLRVSDEALQALPEGIELSPGMPADVFLIAGERSLADYLLSPITDAAYKSFREE